MTSAERWAVIREYLVDHAGGVDILNSDFVDTYIAATKVRFKPTNWGAFKCPTLSADLLAMYRSGRLKRHRAGLAGNWQPGFPKWVWSYRL